MVVAMSAGWWLGSILLKSPCAIAFWPARVHDGEVTALILCFVFSLICFPLALLVAYLVRDRRRAVLA